MTGADDQPAGRRRLEPARYAADLVSVTATSADPGTSLCALAVETLGLSGAGVSLARSGVLECVAVSDPRAEFVEAIEYTTGEGPCVSAFRSSAPSADPDLAGDAVAWPAFRREAARIGIRAAFGFPLVTADSCFGALNLYRDRAGALSTDQHAAALVIAEASGRVLLEWQAAAPPGRLAWQLERVSDDQVQLHQAAGRVSVQLNVSVADSYVLLRAYAFSHDRPIRDIAVEVASGALRIG